MVFIDDCLTDERNECDAHLKEALYERFLEGKTDAAFGRMPEYNDEDYLKGYIAGVKELPTDPETKKIQHYSLYKQFALGWVDGNPEYRDQFGEI
ncbi:MAG: hypothetical protein KME12_27135 [Trichocoleus desertorum ATA4-8-CV12]|jgi:hypothetical protein|nr:hypothetical protein [Trichocoleus desertorum ATA4-8-CV12]